MRIDDKVNIGFDKKIEQGTQKNKSEKTKSSSVSSQNDKISLSDTAKGLASIKNAVKSAPDVRTEKIDKIKSEIAAGNYDVTGKQVAEKIVNTAIDNLF